VVVVTGLTAVVVVATAADDDEKDLSMGTQYMCNLFLIVNVAI
jgi:hypothetical protein